MRRNMHKSQCCHYFWGLWKEAGLPSPADKKYKKAYREIFGQYMSKSNGETILHLPFGGCCKWDEKTNTLLHYLGKKRNFYGVCRICTGPISTFGIFKYDPENPLSLLCYDCKSQLASRAGVKFSARGLRPVRMTQKCECEGQRFCHHDDFTYIDPNGNRTPTGNHIYSLCLTASIAKVVENKAKAYAARK